MIVLWKMIRQLICVYFDIHVGQILIASRVTAYQLAVVRERCLDDR